MGSPLVGDTSCAVLRDQQCSVRSKTLILITISLGITLVYFLLYAYFLLSMVQQLRSLTYQAHKINNLLVRLQVNLYPLLTLKSWYHSVGTAFQGATEL